MTQAAWAGRHWVRAPRGFAQEAGDPGPDAGPAAEGSRFDRRERIGEIEADAFRRKRV